MIGDSLIVIAYILLLVITGLRGGRQVKSVRDFTATEGHYGTAVLFATLSASFVGGGYSAGNAARSFESGIFTTLTLFGFSVSMVLIGRFLVPGVWRFRGEATVGGLIGKVYGKRARLLTGVFAYLCCAGVVGAQMEAMGTVFYTMFGIPHRLGVVIGCSIVLLYSTFGGLQSVIIADIFQFVLLAVGMPLMLCIGVDRAGGLSDVLHALPPAYFDPFGGGSAIGFVSLFLTMMLGEALAPPYTQRLLIGKNPAVTARATIFSGLFSAPFFVVTGLIGMTAFVLRVTDTPSAAMPSLMMTVLPVGLRGIVMASMVSVILSASDSFLNSAAISLVCDTLLPLRAVSDKKGLWLLRLVNLATGVGAMAVAFLIPDIFNILVLAYSFWCPLVLIPLAAALRGIKSSGRTFAVSAAAGLFSSLLWNFALHKPFEIDGAVVGTVCSLVAFLLAHRLDTARRR